MIQRLSLFHPDTMAFFGYLALTSGAAKMFAPRQGTISIFHIEEGQRTHAGQPLLTITINQTTADGTTARSVTWTARSPVGRNKGCWREYFISDRKFYFLTKEQSISMSIERDK